MSKDNEINIEDGSQKTENVDNSAEQNEETAQGVETETEQPVAEEAEEKADNVADDQDPLDVALAEIEELKKTLLYKQAEFENYRKRTIKEKADLILNGGEKTIKAILPVLDDMERAIDNGSKTEDPAVLREGMELIYQKFQKTLEGMGVTKIETADADFDVDVHEAIAMVPGMGDDKKGKVIDCVLTGYKLNEKVIRHAKVAVGQ